jgi:hypothetical protein
VTAVPPGSTVTEQQSGPASRAHLTGRTVVGEGVPVSDQHTCVRGLGGSVVDELATNRRRDHRAQLRLGERYAIRVAVQVVEPPHPPVHRGAQPAAVVGVSGPPVDDPAQSPHT